MNPPPQTGPSLPFDVWKIQRQASMARATNFNPEALAIIRMDKMKGTNEWLQKWCTDWIKRWTSDWCNDAPSFLSVKCWHGLDSLFLNLSLWHLSNRYGDLSNSPILSWNHEAIHGGRCPSEISRQIPLRLYTLHNGKTTWHSSYVLIFLGLLIYVWGAVPFLLAFRVASNSLASQQQSYHSNQMAKKGVCVYRSFGDSCGVLLSFLSAQMQKNT